MKGCAFADASNSVNRTGIEYSIVFQYDVGKASCNLEFNLNDYSLQSEINTVALCYFQLFFYIPNYYKNTVKNHIDFCSPYFIFYFTNTAVVGL